MKRFRISTGTITYAIKGRDLLRRHRFKVNIERTHSSENGSGCGYSLVLSGDLSPAEELLRKAGVKILEIEEL